MRRRYIKTYKYQGKGGVKRGEKMMEENQLIYVLLERSMAGVRARLEK